MIDPIINTIRISKVKDKDAISNHHASCDPSAAREKIEENTFEYSDNFGSSKLLRAYKKLAVNIYNL